MRVCVIGLGYVGAVTATCLARDGHSVLGIDVDPVKLKLLSSGQAPIVEDRINEVTREAVESGRLTVADSIDARIAGCDLIFVCVGTPSAENGSQDLTAVTRVAEQIGRALTAARNFPVIVLRSTVYPGSTETVFRPTVEEHAGTQAGDGFGLCFQPEFLREGTSVDDFYNPPFTIIGSDDKKAVAKAGKIFESLPGEFIVTSFRAAELLKMTCNVFHALKISFANEIGRLGQGLDVDSREVMQLLCRDTSLNISPAYLRPGFAYGGSCLPKDLRAMLYLARTNDIELPMLMGIGQSNALHIEHAAKLVMESGSRKVGLIGLSFKPGTDDLRESPLVTLAETLIGKGYELRIFDPAVNVSRLIGANKRFIEHSIPHFETLLTDNIESVFEHANVLIVGQKNEKLQLLIDKNASSIERIVDLTGLPAGTIGKAASVGACW